MAGFFSPIPVLRIGATSATQAGFISAIPILPIGAGGGVQAGFISVIPGVPIGGTEDAPRPFTPAPVHPPGTSRDAIRRRVRIHDDMLLQLIMAFLQMKDR